MRAMLLTLSLLFSNFALASFNSAKMSWNFIRAEYDQNMQRISLREQAALKPISDDISAKNVERNNCVTYACAERCSQELARLNQKLIDTAKPFAAEKHAATLEPLRQGHELATDAFLDELLPFVENDMGAKLLRLEQIAACAGPYPLASKDIFCRSAILEFRLGNTFFQAVLDYGIPSQPGTRSMDELSKLFARTRGDFLNRSTGNNECSLSQALMTTDCGQSYHTFYEGGKLSFMFNDYSRIGFRSRDVKHNP